MSSNFSNVPEMHIEFHVKITEHHDEQLFIDEETTRPLFLLWLSFSTAKSASIMRVHGRPGVLNNRV
jgi:hypothetical protein